MTSDILSRSDACVHVAHAALLCIRSAEVDYFTVVDDLNRDDETGAAHAGIWNWARACFTAAVDVPLLLSNLTGCDRKDWKVQDSQPAQDVVQSLVRTCRSHRGETGIDRAICAGGFLVLLETGPQQPRSWRMPICKH